jgi:hypothetical protein
METSQVGRGQRDLVVVSGETLKHVSNHLSQDCHVGKMEEFGDLHYGGWRRSRDDGDGGG